MNRAIEAIADIVPYLDSYSAEDIQTFLDKYDAYLSRHEEEKDAEVLLSACIANEVLDTFYLQENKLAFTEAELRVVLDKNCQVTDVGRIRELFKAIKMDLSIRDLTERLMKYNSDFMKVRKRTAGVTIKQKKLIKFYFEGVRPQVVSKYLCELLAIKEYTLAEAVKLVATETETQERYHSIFSLSANKSTSKSNSFIKTPKPFTKPFEEKNSKRWDRGTTLRKKEDICYHCYEKGHRKPYCPKIKCNTCGKLGHMAKFCKSSTSNNKYEKKNNNIRPPRYRPSQVKIQNVQPEELKSNYEDDDHISPPVMQAIDITKNAECMKIPAKVNKEEVLACVDTGAAISCVSQGLLDKLGNVKKLLLNQELTLADGSPVRVKTYTMLEITLPTVFCDGSVEVKWPFVVFENDRKTNIILGCDLLRSLGLLNETGLHLYKKNLPTTKLQNEEWNPIIEDFGDAMAYLIEEKEDSNQREIDKIYVPDSSIKEDLLALLEEYQDLFEEELPPQGADMNPFRIELERDEVVCEKHRPLAPPIRGLVKSEVKDMMKRGIVQDSNGPYCAPIVVVKKPGINKIRICGDYTKLNKITKSFNFPMPDLKDIVLNASGFEFYGSLDLRSGYYQILLHENDICKTAIGTSDDYIEFIRCPFGLKNLPSYFTKEIYCAMAHIPVSIYIDDFLIYGDAHIFLNKLKLLFERSRQKRLRFKASKIKLGVPKVKCIGYVLSKEGREIDPERVKALLKLKPPRNLKEVRMFLGKINWSSEFLPNGSGIAKPLTNLTKKGVPFTWSSECQDAFTKLIHELTNDKILACIQPQDIVVLQSDASDYALGGVLLVDKDGKLIPACYLSATFSGAQLNWTTFEKELYAILYCLTRRQHAQVLKLCDLIIQTDHKNLVYLDKYSETNKKILRWRLILSEYSFKIKHIAGKENIAADTISRLTYDDKPVSMVNGEEEEKNEIIDLIKDQQQTLECAKQPKVELVNGIVLFQGKIVIDNNMSTELKDKIISTFHGNPLAGHSGINSTVSYLKQHYHWANVYGDVSNFIKSCPICQKLKLQDFVKLPLLTTMGNRIFREVSADTIGPVKEDKYGYIYIYTGPY